MASLSKDQLIQQARSGPKDIFGAASLAGYVAAIAGIALFILSVPSLMGSDAFGPDWRLALGVLAGGVALMWWAGGVIQRRFEQAAKSSGFSDAQIREIEDEAERNNDGADS